MSITQTILIFVGIPLAVVLAVYGLVYGTSAARSRRYRPGRVFEVAPVWYTAGANRPAPAGPAHRAELISASGAEATGAEWPEIQRTGETGGASDSW